MTPPPPTGPETDFPRWWALTGGGRHGVPRQCVVRGGRVFFLRSRSGREATGLLSVAELGTGREAVVLDPVELGGEEGPLVGAERARRERAREGGAGVVGFSVDEEGRRVALALGGRLVVVDLGADWPGGSEPVGTSSSGARVVAVAAGVVDPRIDPTGSRVAYVRDRALFVVDLASGEERLVLAPTTPTETVGLADFVAAEELGRLRGFWWAPRGDQVLVEVVDESPVATWWRSDPTEPAAPATPARYPAAGTANARWRLLACPLTGEVVELASGPTGDVEYLAQVAWPTGFSPLVSLLSRDQRRLLVVELDPGAAPAGPGGSRGRLLGSEEDPDWVDVVPGTPARLSDGRLVTVGVRDGSRRLVVDGVAVTPSGLEVRGVEVAGSGVLVVGQADDAASQRLWWWEDGRLAPLTEPEGWATGVAGRDDAGRPVVIAQVGRLGRPGPETRGLRPPPDGPERDGRPAPDDRWVETLVVASRAEPPPCAVGPQILRRRPAERRVAVVLPEGHDGVAPPLPVLMDPYGGPHAQRVQAQASAFVLSQYLANEGFAVVVADGRGTPGPPAFERAVRGDLAGPVLDDQVAALEDAAGRFPALDRSRVGIRGWSFGGFLAALAVLERPDVFHAAVAGAPVTDWRLYDTAYSERYLGSDPDGADADAYRRSGLLHRAAQLRRPLLLVHGLADDNVYVAHSLRLSAALTTAGRPHGFLPLPGVSHMTPQVAVRESLLRLEVAFFRRELTRPATAPGDVPGRNRLAEGDTAGPSGKREGRIEVEQ